MSIRPSNYWKFISTVNHFLDHKNTRLFYYKSGAASLKLSKYMDFPLRIMWEKWTIIFMMPIKTSTILCSSGFLSLYLEGFNRYNVPGWRPSKGFEETFHCTLSDYFCRPGNWVWIYQGQMTSNIYICEYFICKDFIQRLYQLYSTRVKSNQNPCSCNFWREGW